MKKNDVSHQRSVRISFLEKVGLKGTSILITLLLILFFTAGCAAQHRLKKYKPVPCPCEKENKP